MYLWQCATLPMLSSAALAPPVLSRSQKVKPWMADITAPDGTKLHGAGQQYSDGWWKVRQGGQRGAGKVGIGS